MAYQFSTKYTATFEVPVTGAAASTTKLQLSGISARESNADTICNGIASLLAIGELDPEFTDGLRTVKENVQYV